MNTAATSATQSGATPAAPIKALPGSRCLLFGEGRMSYCVAAGDRYVVEATRPKLLDAQQLVAAQVVMLLAK